MALDFKKFLDSYLSFESVSGYFSGIENAFIKDFLRLVDGVDNIVLDSYFRFNESMVIPSVSFKKNVSFDTDIKDIVISLFLPRYHFEPSSYKKNPGLLDVILRSTLDSTMEGIFSKAISLIYADMNKSIFEGIRDTSSVSDFVRTALGFMYETIRPHGILANHCYFLSPSKYIGSLSFFGIC